MRSVAAGVVLLVAVVSGCSAGEASPAEVGPLASSSTATQSTGTVPSALTSATESATAGPTSSQGSTLNASAEAADSLGASAFARRYIAVMNQALTSGDPSELQTLSDPGCGGCKNVVSAIANARRAGQRVLGAELEVKFAEAPEVRGGETIVDLRYQRAAGDVRDARGSLIERIPAEGPIDTQLRVRYVAGAWSVLGFRQIPS